MDLDTGRPPWDVYFMRLAEMAANRATCPRRHVGAVIVRDKRILTTGYNGSPPGLPHCETDGCYLEEGHCVRTLHAEQNALIHASLHGISTAGATIYVTALPCHVCARMLIGAGIKEVIFRDDLPNWSGWARTQFRMARVDVSQMLSDALVPRPIVVSGQDVDLILPGGSPLESPADAGA